MKEGFWARLRNGEKKRSGPGLGGERKRNKKERERRRKRRRKRRIRKGEKGEKREIGFWFLDLF